MAIAATLSTILLSTHAFANSEIISDAMDSDVLKKEIRMKVYLPEGYEDSGKSYPVVYMLHGAESDETSWVDRGGIKVTADALIQRGQLRSSIIVMPTLGKNSWYIDGNSDRAEAALIKDLIPYIEEKYKASSERNGRSIAGLSMGGYGALNLSLSHPDLFCAAGILSPAIYNPLPPETSASRTAPQFLKDNIFDEKMWTESLYPARLEHYKESGTVVPMWIESGDHDALGIVVAAADLYWALHKYQPENIEYRVVDGDHDWMVFRDSSIRALPYMSQKCDAK
ncbi:hypothetical protein CBP31_01940 [Oceanisphaera profunda]|uniref:Esterase n=1 Tax=Oceanisphaera profunda TaxID=1416627 RepID=A0A1Y0D1Z4_9GAMM|nr:alpha/beta hydrolase-fold protein [Oceanisphaera profunda]ART81542.1 hypothetical protein CBP31_01940 [Oceanisphaera profunda]